MAEVADGRFGLGAVADFVALGTLPRFMLSLVFDSDLLLTFFFITFFGWLPGCGLLSSLPSNSALKEIVADLLRQQYINHPLNH